MEKRQNFRASFQQPKTIPATLSIVEGKMYRTTELNIDLHNISLGGSCFSSELDLEINQELELKVDLFKKENRIFGRIVWKKEESDGKFRYGFQIITADCTYFQYMLYYEQCMQNKKKEQENSNKKEFVLNR